MTKLDKIIRSVIDGLSDRNINFDDLCNLLKHLNFEEHIRSSHHIFRRADVAERVNLQKGETKAKAYQVKQVRNVLIKYKLGSR